MQQRPMMLYMHLPAAAARDEDTHTVSPELVLVDPALARAERACLPLPSDPTFAFRPSVASPATGHPIALRVDAPPRRRTPSRVLVAVATTTMLVVLLFDVRVEVGEKHASAERESIETTRAGPAQPKPSTMPPPRTIPKQDPTAPSTPSPSPSEQVERRFAWAPVASATGYHVEFFRGAKRVLARDTTRPELVVPASWVFEGVGRSLRPGVYRWYVWPIVSGARQSQAAVQTTLTIGRD
jgi:hypothetical protein